MKSTTLKCENIYTVLTALLYTTLNID